MEEITRQRSALSSIRRRNARQGADTSTRNRIVQGKNHLKQGNQDRDLVQTWRIEGIEPQAAGLLVILEMTKDRSTVKWLALGVQDTVSFADDREVVTKDHQTQPNLGLGKGGPQVGQQQDQLTGYRLWQ